METESEFELTEGDSTVVLDEVKLHQIVAEDSLHFDEWTSLISEIENTCPDNIERICLVYDSFLSVFPLCYGYWRRYVHHKMRLCTVEEVVEVFERSVLSATYCVDMWVDYCNFGRLVFEDQSDVRRLFKRAISFVGKNYLCHTLWDKYIEFEFSLKHWSSLAHIYIQALRSPTKKLHRYYENFKKLVEIWEGGMKSHSNSTVTVAAEPILNDETSICYNQDALSCIIKDLLDPFRSGLDKLKALHKYRSLGEGLFQDAVQLYEKVDFFETRIKRSYFHVKPLDVSQLQNWHDYLDFAESHGDFNWALQLYERCLIPCANCPEFWMRYVEFLERKGGREIANFALDRATQIHLKRLSVIHLFNARFKEHIGDVFNARAAFLKCSTTSDKDFVENVVMRANMENRLGNSIAASTIYKDALETATAEEKWHILPVLYIHFSRLKLNINDCEDAAIDILIDGIKHVPSCKLLIEELVKFAIMHRGSRHINVIDSIVANAISPQPGGSQGLSLEDGEEISRLYLEFVDLCGTVSDVRKAWNRHIRLFPLSVRDTLFYPAKEARKWKLVMETREETLPRLPNQPPGDCNSDCLAQSPLQVDKLPSSENNDTHQAADPVTDEVLEKKSPVLANHDMQSTQLSDQESALVENLNELSEKEKTDALQSGESDNNSHEDVHQMAYKDSDTMGENIIEPKLSPDLEHQIVNETENTPAALQFNKENDVQTEYNHKLEQDLKLPSLETLSLDTQDANAAPRSPPPHDSEALEETSLSDGSLLKSEAPQKNSISDENILECGQNVNVDHVISSPLSPRATVSTRSNFGNDCPSSLASTQNITGKAFPRPQKQASGKNWHQRNISNKFGRDSKHGFHGHLHKRQHKRQSSPQRTRQRSPMPVNEDYRSHRRSSQNPHRQGGQVQSLYPPSNVHTNESQDWLMHSSQQNLSAACQSQQPTQPAVYPQPQIPQYSLQSNEPQQNLQNNQAYNETWQYYYYQQQLQLFWQQQQLLQHQQPEQQQQQLLQHQYQQQLLQMQYFQQQQQQGQQQQISYQQQQLQQLQQQQQEGQLQQQPYQLQQQQHLLYLQQQQQLQLQPQHQQSQLQLQLQQQQSYHQQQTASSQQDPHGQEQRQSKQQMDTSQIQDGVTPSRNAGEPEINESSASPHPVSSKSMA